MSEPQKSSKSMNILLWVAQAILALTFLWAGLMKIIKPEELPFLWVKDNSTLVLFTGMIDLLAGFGIILPTLLRTKPQLTIYAAYGIIALMIAAVIFHISRGEAKDIGFNVFMILLAVFVAWGRQTNVTG
jgi:drug/metabolite transporter superfamily protein YnfA